MRRSAGSEGTGICPVNHAPSGEAICHSVRCILLIIEFSLPGLLLNPLLKRFRPSLHYFLHQPSLVSPHPGSRLRPSRPRSQGPTDWMLRGALRGLVTIRRAPRISRAGHRPLHSLAGMRLSRAILAGPSLRGDFCWVRSGVAASRLHIRFTIGPFPVFGFGAFTLGKGELSRIGISGNRAIESVSTTGFGRAKSG